MKKDGKMFKKIVTSICCGLIASLASAIDDVPSDQFIQSLSFSDAPLQQVLFVLGELTGKPVLSDSRLDAASINLQIRKEISREEAILAIESALALNDIAVVELGDNLLKAVNAKFAAAQSPAFIETSLLNEKPSEKFCSKIFQLQHLPVSEFSRLITRILSPETSSCIVFNDSNSILITDSVSNLQRVELILSKVDMPKHSMSNSKVFRIKHGDAQNIAALLNNVIKSQHDKKQSNESVDNEYFRQLSMITNSSDFQFSKGITIEHEERSNSIVVCGTVKDIELVSSIIDQIDVLLDQVRVEVVIAEVALTNKQQTGLESFGFDYNYTSGTPAMGNQINAPVVYAGGTDNDVFTFNGNLKDFSLSTVFKKAKDDSHVKVLSAPTIVTTHNREAVVKIVKSLPIIKADISDTSSSTASNTSVKSTIEYKDVGIELKVKPLIGINGVIQMEISQLVESEGASRKINSNSMPTTTKREAVSFVSVCDGDTVVLAGLQEKRDAVNNGKLWLLGDIPVLGKTLFSPKSKEETTAELIIFIKPTIVSNPANEEAFAKRMLNGSELEEEVNKYNETGKFLPPFKMPLLTFMDPTKKKCPSSSKNTSKKTYQPKAARMSYIKSSNDKETPVVAERVPVVSIETETSVDKNSDKNGIISKSERKNKATKANRHARQSATGNDMRVSIVEKDNKSATENMRVTLNNDVKSNSTKKSMYNRNMAKRH